jgi:hypothetical protein
MGSKTSVLEGRKFMELESAFGFGSALFGPFHRESSCDDEHMT